MINVAKMNYKAFKKHCTRRILDGDWKIEEALLSFKTIAAIEKIEKPGFFGRIQSTRAREREWQRIKNELSI